jgi:hypothetical protein
VHSKDAAEKYVAPKSVEELTPEQEEALDAHLQRVQDEKRLALREPGPSWRQWFLYKGAKAYVLVGFVIVNVWEIAWFIPLSDFTALLLVAMLVATVYLELLLFLYLWYRPSPETLRLLRRKGFHATWIRPVEFGRWTPEAEDARAGRLPPTSEGGPQPSEFL